MSNDMTVRGNDFPAVTPNANLRVRKQKIDAEQWEAFVAVCAEGYKLIGDFRKQAAANAKLRATQIDMLNREMKLLEAEFKDEKTTKKRREEMAAFLPAAICVLPVAAQNRSKAGRPEQNIRSACAEPLCSRLSPPCL